MRERERRDGEETTGRVAQTSLGVEEESRRVCRLINCSKLAELSFNICPLTLKRKKKLEGGEHGYEDLFPPPSPVPLVHMILSTNWKQA